MLPAASTANGSNLFDNVDRSLSLVNHDAAINKAKASMIQSSGVNIANMDDSPSMNGNAFRLMIMKESTPRNCVIQFENEYGSFRLFQIGEKPLPASVRSL